MKPKGAAQYLPTYSPTHNAKTTNKFGLTLAILNQLKKFICKKYNIKKVIIIPKIEIVFFR